MIPGTTHKVLARDYVAATVGADILATQYQVVASFEGLDLAALPQAVVLKASHGSGMTCLITGGRGPEAPALEVFDDRSVVFDAPTSAVDPEVLKTTIDRWLTTDYSEQFGEWNYRGLTRLVMAEEYLGAISDGLIELSCYCVRGRVLYAVLCLPGPSKLFVDRIFRRLDIGDWTGRPAPTTPVRTPTEFDRAVRMAESLSAPFEALRVDLYLLDDRIVFGELTHCTMAGLPRYRPASFTEVFGAFWRGETTIPAEYYAPGE